MSYRTLITISLILFFHLIEAQAQTTITIYANSLSSIVQYIKADGTTDYQYTALYQIGRKDGSNGYYSGSQKDIYRSQHTFQLSNIPSNATLSQVKLVYSASGSSTNKFTVTQTSGTKSWGELWSEIGTGTVMESDINYGSSSKVSSALLSAVNNARSSGTIYLGALSQNENSNLTEATLGLSLEITYTVPPSIVNITADNNFTDNSGNGTHGAMVIDGTTRTIPSSGYSITKNSGQNLSLSAVSPQTDNQGYQRIWNAGSGVLSEWQRNFARVSYSQTYSFAVSADDNGATYQAQLRQLSGPKFVYFYQEPDPLYNGGTGYVYAVFSSEVGDVTYSWYASYSPSNMTFHFTPQGNRCQVDYYIPYQTLPTINFTCVASNPYGTDVKSYQLHCALYGYGPASLAFAQNGTLTDENPVLVSSVDNPGVDVTDYYLINKEITPENQTDGKAGNVVKFSIHETDQAKGHTNLDQVELWEVKANPNEFIAITEDGEVITITQVIYIISGLNPVPCVKS